MSEKAAADFVGRLAVDPALCQEFTAALAGAADEPQYFAQAAEFAVQHGYEVGSDELGQFALTAGEGRQLSDDDLSKVAGGVVTLLVRRRGFPALCATNCAAC